MAVIATQSATRHPFEPTPDGLSNHAPDQPQYRYRNRALSCNGRDSMHAISAVRFTATSPHKARSMGVQWAPPPMCSSVFESRRVTAAVFESVFEFGPLTRVF